MRRGVHEGKNHGTDTVPQNEPIEFTHTKTRGLKEGAKEPEPYEPGVTGHEGIGRPKHADVEGEAVQEGSVHPRNPSS